MKRLILTSVIFFLTVILFTNFDQKKKAEMTVAQKQITQSLNSEISLVQIKSCFEKVPHFSSIKFPVNGLPTVPLAGSAPQYVGDSTELVQTAIALRRLFLLNEPNTMVYDSANQQLQFLPKAIDTSFLDCIDCIVKLCGYKDGDTIPFMPGGTKPHAYFLPRNDLIRALFLSDSILGVRVYSASAPINLGDLNENSTHLYVVPVDSDTNDLFPYNFTNSTPYVFDLTHPCPKVCDKNHFNPMRNPFGIFND